MKIPEVEIEPIFQVPTHKRYTPLDPLEFAASQFLFLSVHSLVNWMKETWGLID
jgi:hypothetical protein